MDRGDPGTLTELDLRKWPGLPLRRTDVVTLGRDEHGTWLASLTGGKVVHVVPDDDWWTARHFTDGGWKVDIATPVTWIDGRAVLDDLDLDVRRRFGRTWVEDVDEFEARVAAGLYDAATEARAREATDRLERALRAHDEPFSTVGDHWLCEAHRLDGTDRRTRAVLVDMGGVLLRPRATRPSEAVAARLGLDGNRLHQAYIDAVGGGWEAGRTADDIAAALAARCGVALDEVAEILLALHGNDELDAELMAALTRLRGEVKVGILSNNGSDVRRWWDRLHGLTSMFDAVVISGEERIAKPDPRLFRLAADRLGVELSSCVLVDDAPRNVEGALAVGMAAVLHRDARATIDELDGLLRRG